MRDTGQTARAERELHRAIWAAERGQRDELRAWAWAKLIWVVGVVAHRTAEADAIAEQAGAVIDRVRASDDLRAFRLHATGTLRQVEGRHDEAELLLEEALALRTRLFGTDHPLVALTLNNLGIVAWYRRDYPRAFERYRRALAIARSTLGDDHPNVARMIANVGSVLRRQGHDAEALQLFTEAIRLLERALGPDHPDLASALSGQGQARLHLGRALEAVGSLRRALALRESRGVESEEVAEIRFALARALLASGGDLARAQALARKAREYLIQQAKPGAAPPATVAEIDAWLSWTMR